MPDLVVVPSRTALINVDLQNCFVQSSPLAAPGGLEILERVNRMAAKCRAAGILVVHTRHVLRPDGSNAGILPKIPLVRQGILNRDSESAAFHERLVIEERDVILDKPRFGAFQRTNLEILLHARGIDTVIVTGTSTNVSCETTAREAAVRDFHVLFVSDATTTFGMGDVSAEQLQKATCATIEFAFGKVVTIEELMRAIPVVDRVGAE
jgi:ureidoacrylate peracid hydrolase